MGKKSVVHCILIEDEVLVLIYIAWRKYQLPKGSMYNETSPKEETPAKEEIILSVSSWRSVTFDKMRLFPHTFWLLELLLFCLQSVFYDNPDR